MGSVISSLGYGPDIDDHTRDPLNRPDAVFDYVRAVEKTYEASIKNLNASVRDLEDRMFVIEEACSGFELRMRELKTASQPSGPTPSASAPALAPDPLTSLSRGLHLD